MLEAAVREKRQSDQKLIRNRSECGDSR